MVNAMHKTGRRRKLIISRESYDNSSPPIPLIAFSCPGLVRENQTDELHSHGNNLQVMSTFSTFLPHAKTAQETLD
jgi:hypothetical protein